MHIFLPVKLWVSFAPVQMQKHVPWLYSQEETKAHLKKQCFLSRKREAGYQVCIVKVRHLYPAETGVNEESKCLFFLFVFDLM